MGGREYIAALLQRRGSGSVICPSFVVRHSSFVITLVMTPVYICGVGAVSPAGWGVAPMREALERGEPLPVQSLDRPGGQRPVRARLVPNPVSRPPFVTHPRLRRTSPITHYSAAAAL